MFGLWYRSVLSLSAQRSWRMSDIPSKEVDRNSDEKRGSDDTRAPTENTENVTTSDSANPDRKHAQNEKSAATVDGHGSGEVEGVESEEDDEVNYPHGFALVMLTLGLCLVIFVVRVCSLCMRSTYAHFPML